MQRTILLLFLVSSMSQALAKTDYNHEKLKALLTKAQESNPQIKASKEAARSATYKAKGTGYIPDPMVKFNYFGSPIETRNGPQRSNVMLSQQIPWPQTLGAMERQAESMASVESEKTNLLLLDVSFQIKALVFKSVLLNKKINNKKRMLSSLENLIEVVLARLKVGGSSQAEISRINIEMAKLSQDIRSLEAKLLSTGSNIKKLIGSNDGALSLPEGLSPDWISLPSSFKVDSISFDAHPMTQINKRKIEKASASIEFERSKRLPMMGLSATWFQIDEPEGITNPDGGKDAWAIGASISIPIWSSKYSALESSSISERSSAQASLANAELDLRTKLSNLYDEFQSTKDIVSIFKSDILPQASQSLKANQKSYQQGNVPFDRVIDDYLRLIKYEDRLEDNLTKLATLRAGIEKVLGRSI